MQTHFRGLNTTVTDELWSPKPKASDSEGLLKKTCVRQISTAKLIAMNLLKLKKICVKKTRKRLEYSCKQWAERMESLKTGNWEDDFFHIFCATENYQSNICSRSS